MKEKQETKPEVRKRGPRKKSADSATSEIDQRIAAAIVERGEIQKKISALVYYQDRLARNDQEIQYLILCQQRLNGTSVSEVPIVGAPSTTTRFSHTAEIPPNIGSIPAKQPAPSGANVADTVGAERGFE